MKQTNQLASVDIMLKVSGRYWTINLDSFNTSDILEEFILAARIHRNNSVFPGLVVI